MSRIHHSTSSRSAFLSITAEYFALALSVCSLASFSVFVIIASAVCVCHSYNTAIIRTIINTYTYLGQIGIYFVDI